MRTYVYVDAFNLYYGCLKNTPYRWLNIAELSRRMLAPGNVIHRIKYFTAHVSARPNDPDAPARQQIYLRALRTVPEVEIHLGQFLSHPVTMPRVVPPGARQTYVQVMKTEEKGSDVNIATHLVSDAYEAKYDVAVLITNDSDLLTPVLLVSQRLRRRVGILNPHNPERRASVELQRAATFYKRIRAGVLKDSQFPDQLTDVVGTFHKPAVW
jgi:uncharacterized LabA/DUF88 family protein